MDEISIDGMPLIFFKRRLYLFLIDHVPKCLGTSQLGRKKEM